MRTARSAGVSTVLVILSLAFFLSLARADRLPGDYMHEYTLKYLTPHIPWAKPWAQGQLRVFFLTPFNGAAREVAEVWQRADIEVFGETTVSTDELGRTRGCFPDVQDTSPDEKAQRLVRKLSERTYDVFVIGNFNWSALPTQVQYLLLKQVAEGAGLVIVYPREVGPEILKHPQPAGRDWMLGGVPLQAIPFIAERLPEIGGYADQLEALKERLVQTYRAGEGRVVVIDYALDHRFEPCAGGHGLTPREGFDFEEPTYYEYRMALVIRAILWAGGKPATVRMQDLSWPQGFTARLDGFTVRVQSDDPLPPGLRLHWCLRNRWGEKKAQDEVPVPPSGGEEPPSPEQSQQVTIELPAVPHGVHFLELLLDSERGREDFGAVPIDPSDVSSPATVAQLEAVEGPLGAGVRGRLQPPTASVRVELRDNYGRLFYVAQDAEAPEAAQDGSFSWRVPRSALNRAVSSCVRVRAQAVAEGKVSDEQEVVLTVPHGREEEYPVCMWGMMPGYVGHLAAQRIRELGFNIVLGGTNADNARSLAIEDLGNIPYCARIADRDHFVNSEAIAAECELLTECGRQLARFRPHVYSLGDENAIPGDLGSQPEDKPWLLDSLERRYASLEELNDAWGTEFATWEDIEPLSTAEAKARRKYTAWHDILSFREELYAQRHHDYADAIRVGDPQARVGAEGSEEADLELTIAGPAGGQPLEFWGPYRELRYNTLLRSVAPRNLVRGNWFGGYRSQRRDPGTLPSFLWNALFDGNNLVQYFALATLETLFNTDLSLAYYNEWFWDDFQALLDGPAQLVQRAAYDYDPVAVLHSQASLHMSGMEDGPGLYHESHTALLTALNEAWLQHYYITDRHPDQIDPQRVRLLFLPCARALSEEVCAALERYVEDGGVLVADLRPAVLDGSCAIVGGSQLGELFGVRIGAEPNPQEAVPPVAGRPPAWSGEYEWEGGLFRLPGGGMPKVVADASVQLSGGEALCMVSGVPTIICHRHGRGLAVMLNFGLETVSPAGSGEPREPLAQLVRALAQAADVARQAEVIGGDGSPVADCRLARFRYGDTIIHGVLLGASHAEPLSCTLRFAQPAHLYDALEGKDLGHTDSVGLELTPAHGRLICALPEELTNVEVVAPSRAKAGEDVRVRVHLRGSGARDQHLVRLHVVGPDGERRRFYDRTLVVEGEQARATVPFAFNDDPGPWTIEARDVATGLAARTDLQLAVP